MYYGLQSIAPYPTPAIDSIIFCIKMLPILPPHENYRLADSLRQKMFEAYNILLTSKSAKNSGTGKTLRLAKAENKALKAQNNVTLLAVLMFVLLLSAGLVYFPQASDGSIAKRKLQIEAKYRTSTCYCEQNRSAKKCIEHLALS